MTIYRRLGALYHAEVVVRAAQDKVALAAKVEDLKVEVGTLKEEHTKALDTQKELHEAEVKQLREHEKELDRQLRTAIDGMSGKPNIRLFLFATSRFLLTLLVHNPLISCCWPGC
jgi:hypothetical protein